MPFAYNLPLVLAMFDGAINDLSTSGSGDVYSLDGRRVVVVFAGSNNDCFLLFNPKDGGTLRIGDVCFSEEIILDVAVGRFVPMRSIVDSLVGVVTGRSDVSSLVLGRFCVECSLVDKTEDIPLVGVIFN